jgi:hypothetical protein
VEEGRERNTHNATTTRFRLFSKQQEEKRQNLEFSKKILASRGFRAGDVILVLVKGKELILILPILLLVARCLLAFLVPGTHFLQTTDKK